MMKRILQYVALGVVGVAIVGGVYWWWQRAGQPDEGERSATVKRGTMLVAVSASGGIEPRARVALPFDISGRVADVAVEVGDHVEAGDVLAQLDDEQLALQVEQARAAVLAAEAQLIQAQAGPRAEEIAAAEANLRALEAQVSAATANLDQLRGGASAAQIAAAEAQVAAAELEHRVTLIAHDRTLAETEDEDRIRQARYNLYVAEKRVESAQAQLDELLAGADVDAVRAAQFNVATAAAQRDAAQAQLDLLLAGATADQVDDLKAQVAQAQAGLKLAELAQEQTVLRAPFAGVVAAVNVKVGELASAALPAITLLDPSSFRANVLVDEVDVGRLELGQVVEVTLDALPGARLTGHVANVAPAATFQEGVVYYDVAIHLSPSSVPLRTDMTANVTIIVEELTDVLMIPTWIVRVDRETGQTFINQRVGGEIVRTDVELGVRYEGTAQVLSGLSEGDVGIWVETPGAFGF